MARTLAVPRISWSRAGALPLLYAYTLLGAGAVGTWMIAAPASFAAAFATPAPDVYHLGIVGAVYAAFAVMAAIGLRHPDAVAPVFFLQLAYKAIWLLFVFAPRALAGDTPPYAWILAAVFVTYVILDLVALPFGRLRGRHDG